MYVAVHLMRLALIATFTVVSAGFASRAFAQAVQSDGQTYGNPQWGQTGTPTWGEYQSSIGQNGWSGVAARNQVPAGAPVLTPNQANTNFQNPRTGMTLFTPQDSRFKGRDRP